MFYFPPFERQFVFSVVVFDSFCTAFSTASTGGFSVRNASIAAYNSVGLEVTLTVFMLIFSVNFNVYYLILVGHFFKAVKNEELGWFLGIYQIGRAHV